MSRRSVQGGWCSRLTNFGSKCALERSECSNEHVYYSSRQISSNSACLDPTFLKEKSLGLCADNTCSPNEASCGDMGFYNVPIYKTCLVEDTLFGRCGDRCSWSPDDCVDENWIFPSPDCSCDQVQVGACKFNEYNMILCAVSPDGCDAKTTWLSPSEVVSTTDFQCYLCREKNTGIYHDPNVVVIQEPDEPDDLVVNNEEPDDPVVKNQEPDDLVVKNQDPFSPAAEDNTESSSRAIAIFIGGITGGVIGTAMVCAIFLYIRKRQIQTSKGDGDKTAPCVSVIISKKDDVSLISAFTR